MISVSNACGEREDEGGGGDSYPFRGPEPTADMTVSLQTAKSMFAAFSPASGHPIRNLTRAMICILFLMKYLPVHLSAK